MVACIPFTAGKLNFADSIEHLAKIVIAVGAQVHYVYNIIIKNGSQEKYKWKSKKRYAHRIVCKENSLVYSTGKPECKNIPFFACESERNNMIAISSKCLHIPAQFG